MTVLLVLFTLIVFLVVDHFVQRARTVRAEAVLDRSLQELVPRWLRFPDDTILANNHVWVRSGQDGNTTIGLDEFLGRLVGAVESIALPDVGTLVTPATADIALCRGVNTIPISSPLIGRVVEVNPEVIKDPSLARRDPYGKGWLMKVRPNPEYKGAFQRFVIPKPAEWLKQQTEAAREFFNSLVPQGQLGFMQDGGIPAVGLLQQYDGEVWKAFKDSFVNLDHHKHASSERRETHA